MGSRVRVLSRKIDGIYRRQLGNSGITENQLSLMMALYQAGAMEQKRLGALLHLEKSGLGRSIGRLVTSGLVAKTGPINKPTVKLTEAGRKKVASMIHGWEIAMDKIHGVLDAHEVTGFDRFERGVARI